jgi:RNA polymerase sigma-70 factor (sigma-E family)
VASVEDEFIEFAEAAAPQLRRTAFLLCGDWHSAEDLAQTALAKVFVAWRSIRKREAAHAFATRTLVNTYLADKRKKRPSEVLTDRIPDLPVLQPAPELRLVMLEALDTLPPKSRAVVVLRYWADQSVEEVAATLGCSVGNVKSQSLRALARLREQFADSASGPGSAANPGALLDGQTGGRGNG